MELEIEYSSVNEEFCKVIVGVTKDNPDGKNRQDILKRTMPGDMVELVRQYDNQYDPDAVAIIYKDGEQLGFLPKGDRLSHYIDSGGSVSARIKKITGGPGVLGRLIPYFKKNYGCVLNISKEGYDWEKITPFQEESKAIEGLLDVTKDLEKTNPELAIENYKESISKIDTLDSKGRLAASWRRARNPINRLSMLLEKNKQYQEAYSTIVNYESKHDVYGLLSTDQVSLEKRKIRLQKKLDKINGNLSSQSKQTA